MVDFSKKVKAHRSDVLHPGEEVVAAINALPPGSTKRAIGFGIGGAVGGVIAAAGQRGKEGDGDGEGGAAARIPAGKNVVLAVTPLRFLVFEHKMVSGNPGELFAEFPLRDVSVEAEKRKLTHLVTLGFSDGTSVAFEMPRAAKPERFLEGFTRAKG